MRFSTLGHPYIEEFMLILRLYPLLFQSQLFVLFEHAAGYALFKVNEFEETGMLLPQVEASITDLSRFNSVVKLVGFSPFKTAVSALENMNSISEGGYFMHCIIVGLCVACARELVSDQLVPLFDRCLDSTPELFTLASINTI